MSLTEQQELINSFKNHQVGVSLPPLVLEKTWWEIWSEKMKEMFFEWLQSYSRSLKINPETLKFILLSLASIVVFFIILFTVRYLMRIIKFRNLLAPVPKPKVGAKLPDQHDSLHQSLLTQDFAKAIRLRWLQFLKVSGLSIASTPFEIKDLLISIQNSQHWILLVYELMFLKRDVKRTDYDQIDQALFKIENQARSQTS